MRRLILVWFWLLAAPSGFAQESASLLAQSRRKETGQLVTSENGYKLWVQQAGQGPTKLLILCGGPGDSHAGYRPFLELLPQHHIQVSILDLVDCGLSDRTQNPSYWTLPNYLRDLETVRKQLGLEQCYLLGHSFGGLVAFEYAATQPAGLQGLIVSNMNDSWQGVEQNVTTLLDSLVRADSTIQHLNRQAQPLDTASIAYQRLSFQIDSLTYTLLSEAAALNERAVLPVLKPFFSRELTDPLLRQNIDVYRHFYNTHILTDWDMRPRLARITVPTLLLGAGQDYALSFRDMLRIQAQLPHGTIAYCPQGGHVPFWTQNDCYYQPLLRFLNRVP